jgi:hypothetical protein
MYLVSGWQGTSAESLPSTQSTERAQPGFGITALSLNQPSQLDAEEGGDRETPLGGEHTGLLQRLFVQTQSDVAGDHVIYV